MTLFFASASYPSLAGFSLASCLRLIRSEQVGPVTFFQLLRRFGTPEAALEAIPSLARSGGRKGPIRLASLSEVEKEIEATHKHGAQFLLYGAPGYPASLMEIPDAPPVLACKGDAALWQTRETVAIVGARNASANGCMFAEKLARELSENGYIVASGLARGIDAAVHKGALARGTVGVIAGGIDHIYPPENTALFGAMAEQGAILAEMPFGAAPVQRSFPSRNRIIAGISRALVVIEASLQSGSLITARQAGDYGREVLAVPGSPMDPRCRGSNLLLKEGAALIETAEDVLQTLRRTHVAMPDVPPYEAGPVPSPTEAMLAEARPLILEKLGSEGVSVDALIAQTGIAAPVILTILLELELAGRLWRGPGQTVGLRFFNDSSASL